MTRSNASPIPARAAKTWRALVAAAKPTLGQRVTLMRHEATLRPRFAHYYERLAAMPRRTRSRLLRRARLSAAGFALLCAIGQAPVLAAGITVGATCTLTDAITAANTDAPSGGCAAGSGADTITLPANSTITLTSVNNGSNGLPQITSAITIEGQGATIRRESTAPAFRIFEVVAGGTLTLNRTTVSGGGSSSAGFVGGAIRNNAGTVILTNTTISGNTARAGGGIHNAGTLSLFIPSSVAIALRRMTWPHPQAVAAVSSSAVARRRWRRAPSAATAPRSTTLPSATSTREAGPASFRTAAR